MGVKYFSANENVILPIFVLTTFIGIIAAQGAQEQGPYDQLANHWFSKCQAETNNSTQAFDKLYADGVEFKRYLKYAFKFIPEQTKNFCNSERGILNQKMKELSRDMKPCLSSSEKYMSDFVYESFTEFLHFLCHDDATNLNTFFSPNAKECREKLLQNSENPNIGTCFSRLLKPSSTGHPSKKDLCGDITVVKSCFADTLSNQCPSYAPYRKLNEEFFKYVSKPCSGCSVYFNTLLLLVSVFAYLFGR
ncbi:unnamed protein product [Phyllotreta striolata]|uniref:Uncharacterized protein n=1 Tax=Phyllotreta striolata TaxID=444603 RepID=A0A9N9TXD6_PHYSR|nr:unnamed protein product [Phyllotreta striolata]